MLLLEDELSEEALESLADLIESNDIAVFVNNNPVEKAALTDKFVEELKNKGYLLEDRLVRKLIREEYNRSLNDPPVFDLEYDTVLKHSLELFQNGHF